MKTFGERLNGVNYVDRPGAYAFLRNAEGKLALVKTSFGVFLPGGGIDPGESVATALARELLEEIAFEVTSSREVGQAAQYHWSAFYKRHFKKIGSFFEVEGRWVQHPTPPDHELVWRAPEAAVRELSQEFQSWMTHHYLGRQK